MHFVPFEHLWTGTGVPATPVWDQGGQYCLRLCDSYSNRHVQVNNLPLSADTMVWNWVPAQRLRVFLEPSLGSLDILQALQKIPFEPLKTTSSKSSWKTVFSSGDHINIESLRTPCAMLHRALYCQSGPGSTYGRTLSSCQKSTHHFMQCNPSGLHPYMLLLIWASVFHVSDVLSSTTSQDPEHTRRIRGPPTFHSIWKVGYPSPSNASPDGWWRPSNMPTPPRVSWFHRASRLNWPRNKQLPLLSWQEQHLQNHQHLHLS